MFKASIRSFRLQELLKCVAAVSDEARFSFSTDGLSVKVVDPANVALIDASLKRGAFQSYEGDEGSFGVYIPYVLNILDQIPYDTPVELEFDEKLTVIIPARNWRFVLELSPLERIRMSPKVPVLDLPVKVMLFSDVFDDALRAADTCTDYVVFGRDNDLFYISSGDDGFKAEFREGDYIELKVSTGVIKQELKSMFSLDYLLDISKAVQNCGTGEAMVLHIGHDYPCILEFGIADGHGIIAYLQAPRIESEG